MPRNLNSSSASGWLSILCGRSRRPHPILSLDGNQRGKTNPLPRSPSRRNRPYSAMAGGRTYEQALQLLVQLQSNKTVTNLFASANPPADLNALAIPEMRAWLRRAGYEPHDLAALRCVHVAGTKGKGSVAALTASILARYYGRTAAEEGEERRSRAVVGTYSSPHVASVRERIALDGRPLDRERFARYFFEVWDRLTQAAVREGDVVPDTAKGGGGLEGPATKPFYFRFLTILAWHVFLREGVRSAVVECGIGGEYDSTNVLPAEAVTAAVVTQLGVDHVAMLGSTVEQIAWHKAGIFKEGVKAFTRKLPPGQEGVMAVLRGRAREKGATLAEIPDSQVEAWGGVSDAALQGPFQKYNMALAVAAAREHILRLGGRFEGAFGNDDYQLDSMPAGFKDGLKAAALPGRCEVYLDKDGVEWFLDGAHTEDSLSGVGEWFASRVPAGKEARRVLLFNQQERDSESLLRTLLSSISKEAGGIRETPFDLAIFTRNEERPPSAEESGRDLTVQERSCEVARDSGFASQTTSQDSVGSSLEFVRAFSKEAKRDGRPCKVLVTGSFHLVGPVIRSIEHVEC